MSLRDVRNEGGSALLVTVMLLVLMGGLAMASLEIVTRDRQVAGFQNRSVTAFYAAEAGAAEGRSLVRTVSTRGALPDFPDAGDPETLGDSGTYEHGQPTYYGDPVFPDPVRYARDGQIYANGGNMRMGGQKFVKTLWQINVVGTATGGSRSRVEVVETKILSKGY